MATKQAQKLSLSHRTTASVITRHGVVIKYDCGQKDAAYLIQPWTPDSWDSGYVDNRGYFRVYRPDYPRCWTNGYAKRYHVVWWLTTGVVLPATCILHHKDGNTLNDIFVNLELLDHGAHTTMHKTKPKWQCICKNCRGNFELPHWRKKQGQSRGSFCSPACYYSHRCGQ